MVRTVRYHLTLLPLLLAAACGGPASPGPTGPAERLAHDPEIYFVLQASTPINSFIRGTDTARMEWYDQRGLIARRTLTVRGWDGVDSAVVCAFFMVAPPTDSMRFVFTHYDSFHNVWTYPAQSNWWNPWTVPAAEPAPYWHVVANGYGIGMNGQSNDTSFCSPGMPRDSITATTP